MSRNRPVYNHRRINIDGIKMWTQYEPPVLMSYYHCCEEPLKLSPKLISDRSLKLPPPHCRIDCLADCMCFLSFSRFLVGSTATNLLCNVTQNCNRGVSELGRLTVLVVR